MYAESTIKEKREYIKTLERNIAELEHKLREEDSLIQKMCLSNAIEKYGLKEGDKIQLTKEVNYYQGFDKPIHTTEETTIVYFKQFGTFFNNYGQLALYYCMPKKDGTMGKREQWIYLFEVKDIKKL